MLDSEQNRRPPARVLCLDGGGIRGLSSLMILRNIMNKIADDEKAEAGSLRPCDYFDFICGTSTGGIIAVLLGRLKLTTDQAIEQYITLSKDIFSKDRSSSFFGTKMRMSMHGQARFDANILEEKVRKTVEEYTGNANERMYEASMTGGANETSQCHVAVVAVFADRVNNPQPQLLRTYDRNDTCKIWEAVRATSAAPTFFEPIEVGIPPIKYVDAGLGYNNPAEVAFEEVDRLWPGRQIGIFLSLGTGKEDPVALQRSESWLGLSKQLDLINAVAKMATSAARVHDQIYRRFQKYSTETIYYRFNVDQGLASIGLQEWNRASELAGYTTAYMLHAETDRARLRCVARIQRFSGHAKPYELSAAAFRAIHDEDLDTDQPEMRYWYREALTAQSYPSGVSIAPQFQNRAFQPIGTEILSLRRICNLLIRGEAYNISPGKYRVRWLLWFWAGKNIIPTSKGVDRCFRSYPEISNMVTERRFPAATPGIPPPENDLSGFFYPHNLKLSVGRGRNMAEFMHIGLDRHRDGNAAGALLAPGYKEQVIDAGMWGSMRNLGWVEAEDIVVDVASDGYLAFVIAMDWTKPYWIGGFSFGGVRLVPIVE